MAGSISAAQRLGNTAAKKRRSGASHWWFSVKLDRPGNRPQTFQTDSNVLNNPPTNRLIEMEVKWLVWPDSESNSSLQLQKRTLLALGHLSCCHRLKSLTYHWHVSCWKTREQYRQIDKHEADNQVLRSLYLCCGNEGEPFSTPAQYLKVLSTHPQWFSNCNCGGPFGIRKAVSASPRRSHTVFIWYVQNEGQESALIPLNCASKFNDRNLLIFFRIYLVTYLSSHHEKAIIAP